MHHKEQLSITAVTGIIQPSGNTSLTDTKTVKKLAVNPYWVNSIWNGENKWLVLWEDDYSFSSYNPLLPRVDKFEETDGTYFTSTYYIKSDTELKLARVEQTLDDPTCYYVSEINGKNQIVLIDEVIPDEIYYYASGDERLVVSYHNAGKVDDGFISYAKIYYKISNDFQKDLTIDLGADYFTGDNFYNKYNKITKSGNIFTIFNINNSDGDLKHFCTVIQYNSSTNKMTLNKTMFELGANGKCYLDGVTPKAVKLSSDNLNIIKVENNMIESVLYTSNTEIGVFSVFNNGDYVYRNGSGCFNSLNQKVAQFEGIFKTNDYSKSISIEDFIIEELPSGLEIENIYVGLPVYTYDEVSMTLYSNSIKPHQFLISHSEQFRVGGDRYIPVYDEDNSDFVYTFPLFIQFNKYIPRFFRNKYKSQILESIHLWDDDRDYTSNFIYFIDINNKTLMIVGYIANQTPIDPYGGGGNA